MGKKAKKSDVIVAAILLIAVIAGIGAFEAHKLNNKKAVLKDDLELRYQQQAIVCDVDSLEMRDEPSMNGNVIAYIPNGETVRIVQTGDDWHFVEYGEKTGWCDDSCLQLRTVKK